MTSRRPPPALPRLRLGVRLLWLGAGSLLGWGRAAPPSVTLLSSPGTFAVTSASVTAGGQLTALEGGVFDVLFDPGRCGSTTYLVTISRSSLNWPAGLGLQLRTEGLAADGNCKAALPALTPYATYTAIPTTGGLSAVVVAGPLRATLRYRLDFTGMANSLSVGPGVYTTAVTYTITAP